MKYQCLRLGKKAGLCNESSFLQNPWGLIDGSRLSAVTSGQMGGRNGSSKDGRAPEPPEEELVSEDTACVALRNAFANFDHDCIKLLLLQFLVLNAY